jgi:hypothetical protein
VSNGKLWKKLEPYINPNKKTQISPKQIINNSYNNSTTNVSNLFVNYFSSITNKFKFEPYKNCFKYIDYHFNNISSLKQFTFTNPKFKIREFELKEVSSALGSLSKDSAAGNIEIDTAVLKGCAQEIAKPLTELFNRCLSTGEIPDEFKIAQITPIYKGKGSKSDLENYRPISVLSPISKIFEMLLAERITDYFESNGLFNNIQFGFRKNLSCEIALNTMMEDWREALDGKDDVVSVFLDLSKAFDTIDHSLFLKKLDFYNFDESAINLLKNYLNNRLIKVKLNQTQSKSKSLKVGVPQGSILGPLFFIIFINDFDKLNLSSKLILFADDSTLYLSGKDIEKLIETVKDDLKLISKWLDNNRLLINWKKTVAMHIPSSSHKKFQYKTFEINIDGNSIPFVVETKMLGVTIDNQLTFTKHISNLCKKINTKSFLLAKSNFLFSNKFKTTLFKLFIQSQFDYCATLFMHISDKSVRDRLVRCFDKSVGRILGKEVMKLNDVEQYEKLKEFNLMPFNFRQFYHFITFTFSLIFFNNKKLTLKERIMRNTNKKTHTIQTRRSYAIPLYISKLSVFNNFNWVVKAL